MATVTNTVKLPDGSTPDRVDVIIELVASTTGRAAGWVTATDVTILSTVRPTVTAGAWSASLTPNADITPSGTVYKISEYADRTRYVHYISVGSAGGSVFDLLTDAPAAIEPSALAAHKADTDDAHDASAVSIVAPSSMVADTVQEAVDALARRSDLLARIPSQWGKFAPQGQGVRLSRSGTSYTMWQHLGAQVWARRRLASEAGTPGGGNLVRRLNGDATQRSADVVAPVLLVDDTSGTIAYTGTGWGTITQASAYGGTYQRPTTAGAKATWTTPAGVTRVGMFPILVSNGGIAKVTIDGSTTAANLLPTAQQLVDAGAPSSILAGSGGPFAATDRVIDFYSAATVYQQHTWLADDLHVGQHTVVIEMTSAKQTAASDSRIYIDGFFYATPSTTVDTASVVCAPLAQLTTTAATTDEYAVLSNNGGSDTWIGGTHGYETEGSLSFAIDGSAVSLADGASQAGTQIVASRTTTLYHPSVGGGATPVATTSLTYTLDNLGLYVYGSITWAATLTVTRCYVGMFTGNGLLLKKATTPLLGSTLTLTTNDGGYSGDVRDVAGLLWDDGSYASGPGRAAVLVLVSPSAVADWVNSNSSDGLPRFMSFEDRTAGSGYGHKVYPTRVAEGSTESVANGTVWTVEFLHRIQFFDRTAALLP